MDKLQRTATRMLLVAMALMKHENGIRMKHLNIAMILTVLSFGCAGVHGQGYPDGRPAAKLRIDAKDQGGVLRHGDGRGQCDYLGAREALIFEENGTYHLFYDGTGPKMPPASSGLYCSVQN